MGKKQRKRQDFLGCLVSVFIFRHSSPFVFIYLVVCKCVIHHFFLSFVVMFFLLCCGCASLFLFIFIFIVLFTFHSLFLYCIISWCDKPRSKHKISEMLIFMFCFGARIPTLLLGPDNDPTWPENNPSKCFLPCLLLLTMC